MIDKFDTEEKVREEILHQLRGDKVTIHSLRKEDGGVREKTGKFSMNGFVYKGEYWVVTIDIHPGVERQSLSGIDRAFARGVFTGTILLCTPEQYRKACIAHDKEEWLEDYPLDTLTYIYCGRCEALPRGGVPSIRQLPRTLRQYIMGWHSQPFGRRPGFKILNRKATKDILKAIREGTD